MKEIIYLDTRLVNSLLAQTNSGLVSKLINENSESDSSAEGGAQQRTSTGTFGVKAIATGELSHSDTQTDSYNLVFSKSNRNLIETALDDYSLDVLLDSLKDKIKRENYIVGDLALICDSLLSYNFETLINAIELKGIGKHLDGYEDFQANRARLDKLKASDKHLDKNKQLIAKVESSGWNNFHIAKTMAEYMNSLFPNTTLIKIADTLSICNDDMIRLNAAVLNFNNISERKAKVLGIISSKFPEKIITDFSKIKKTDSVYRNAPSMLSNILLGSNDIIDEDDFIIRPIAIYFEN